MGKVVDARCRVMGVRALRVVDVSMIPVPLAAHYQALSLRWRSKRWRLFSRVGEKE